MLSRSCRKAVIAWNELERAKNIHLYAKNFVSPKFHSKISEAKIDLQELDTAEIGGESSPSTLSKDDLKYVLKQASDAVELVISQRKDGKLANSKFQKERTILKSKFDNLSCRNFQVEKSIESKKTQCARLGRKIADDKSAAFQKFILFLLSIVFWAFFPGPIISAIILVMSSDKSSSWFNPFAMLGSAIKYTNRISKKSLDLQELQHSLKVQNAKKQNLIEDEIAESRDSIQIELDAQKGKMSRAKKKWEKKEQEAIEQAINAISRVFAFQALAEASYQEKLNNFCSSLTDVIRGYSREKAELNENADCNEEHLSNYAQRMLIPLEKSDYWDCSSDNGYRAALKGNAPKIMRIGHLSKTSFRGEESSLNFRNLYSQSLLYENFTLEKSDLDNLENLPFTLSSIQSQSSDASQTRGPD